MMTALFPHFMADQAMSRIRAFPAVAIVSLCVSHLQMRHHPILHAYLFLQCGGFHFATRVIVHCSRQQFHPLPGIERSP